MKISFLEQVSGLLKDREKRTRWLSVVLCLALAVTAGTFYMFKRDGLAMVHTEKILQCPLKVHIHTENCDEGRACGIAEYVFHTHGDFCYNADGELVCTLDEIPAHVHGETCWKTENVLSCGLEEGEGHVHTPECYPAGTEETKAPPAAAEQHVLSCGQEEHSHDASCYAAEEEAPTLICGQEESEGHTHTGACYTRELICREEENHVHSDRCYELVERRISVQSAAADDVEGMSDPAPVPEPEPVSEPEPEPAPEPEPEPEPEPQPEPEPEPKPEPQPEPQPEPKPSAPTVSVETEKVLICRKAEHHIHTDACYRETLTCSQRESAGHKHSASCCAAGEAAKEPACGRAEHIHTDACYTENTVTEPEVPETEETPICGIEVGEGHHHSEACYQEVKTLICPLPGVHTHTRDCRGENSEFLCGQLQLEDHVHGAACLADVPAEEGVAGAYICGKEEHQHNAFCGVMGLNWCGKEEHIHNKGCLPQIEEEEPNEPEAPPPEEAPNPEETPLPEVVEPELPEGKNWVCGRVSHRHDPSICYSEAGDLVCERQEHTHTEECLPPKDPEKLTLTETYSCTTEDGLFNVVFRVDGEAMIPVEEALSALAMSEEESGFSEPPAAEPPAAEPELVFTAKTLKGTDYDYLVFSESAKKLDEQFLTALSLTASYGGKELDLSGCAIVAEITPTEALLASMLEPANNASEGEEAGSTIRGVRLTAYEKDDIDGMAPLESVFIENEGENPENGFASGGWKASGIGMSTLSVSRVFYDAGLVTMEESFDGADAASPTPEPPAASAAPNVPAVGTDQATITVTLDDGIVALTGAREINPEFRVQYYAYMNRIVVAKKDSVESPAEANATLDLIDTSGGRLPQNGSTNPITNMFLPSDSGRSLPIEKEYLEPIFGEQTYRFFGSSSPTYVDLLPKHGADSILDMTSDGHYELGELWVLREGQEATDDVSCWTVYTENLENLHFTNMQETVDQYGENYILITDQTVIRIVYRPTKGPYSNGANFHDYDITNGLIYTTEADARSGSRPHSVSEQKELEKKGTVYVNASRHGINSAPNDQGSGARLAFGNKNTGGELSDQARGGYKINQAEPKNTGNCSFKISASSLGENGSLRFNSGVSAPNLFDETGGERVPGRTDYLGNLSFSRDGDTYTLTTANVRDNGEIHTLSNLNEFEFTAKSWSTKLPMFSNSFWAMDGVSSHGTDGHDLKFGSAALENQRRNLSQTMPSIDGGVNVDHNAYFGMQFSVNFKLTEEYIGPLEYIFYGDDDMWVYLVGEGKNELICDIGGVHGSVGEYVDLRDYLPDGSEGEYTLYFFYTERGASGSCCWMQFTLPQATSGGTHTINGELTKTLVVGKTVEGPAHVDPEREFSFHLKALDKNGQPLTNAYPFEIFDSQGNLKEIDGKTQFIAKGGEADFKMRRDEMVRIYYLPEGATYTITETITKDDPFQLESPDISIDGDSASGTISGGSNEGTLNVTLVNKSYPMLPETGGPGTAAYTLFGGLLVLWAGAGLVRRRGREREI